MYRCRYRIQPVHAEFDACAGVYPLVTPRTPAHSRNRLCSLRLEQASSQQSRDEHFYEGCSPSPPRKRLWKCLFFLDLQRPHLKHPPRYQEDYNFDTYASSSSEVAPETSSSIPRGLQRLVGFVGSGNDGHPLKHPPRYQEDEGFLYGCFMIEQIHRRDEHGSRFLDARGLQFCATDSRTGVLVAQEEVSVNPLQLRPTCPPATYGRTCLPFRGTVCPQPIIPISDLGSEGPSCGGESRCRRRDSGGAGGCRDGRWEPLHRVAV